MKFSKKIIRWYRDNKRELPWRKTTDPYKIWLSEIILQQTRIEQGTIYYLRFITQYPDIESLAKASEQEILKLWQGLGYYSRARNLHKTAKTISQDLNGIFPNTFEELIMHKGIGEYTAAAIASIAFGIARPVIDGNVFRFLARFYGIVIPINSTKGKNKIKKLAEELIDHEQPGDFNQAIMEFGALVCKPQNPDCKSCIFKRECVALKDDKVKILPIKTKGLKQKTKYFNYIILKQKQDKDTQIVLNHRKEKDIWQNMYDFPLIETSRRCSKLTISEMIREQFGLSDNFAMVFRSSEYRHILSHRIIFARFYIIQFSNITSIPERVIQNNATYRIVNLEEIKRLPIPRLVDKFLSENMDNVRD